MPFKQITRGDKIANVTHDDKGNPVGKPHGVFPSTPKGRERADKQLKLLWGTLGNEDQPDKEGKMPNKARRILAMAKAYRVQKAGRHSPGYYPVQALLEQVGQKQSEWANSYPSPRTVPLRMAWTVEAGWRDQWGRILQQYPDVKQNGGIVTRAFQKIGAPAAFIPTLTMALHRVLQLLDSQPGL